MQRAAPIDLGQRSSLWFIAFSPSSVYRPASVIRTLRDFDHAYSHRQLLANAAIAASPVAPWPCVGVRSSW